MKAKKSSGCSKCKRSYKKELSFTVQSSSVKSDIRSINIESSNSFEQHALNSPTSDTISNLMPLQNRVSPFGDIVAVSARGTCMGNRGIIHDAKTKTLLTRRWQHQAWICCVLSFKGYQHPIMGSSAYTELFFLDEATALAAGHRPCAYCRRKNFNAFKAAWIKAKPLEGDSFLNAPGIDKTLHRERVTRKREKVTYVARIDDLPDGVMVAQSGRALLILGDHVIPWTPYGYQKGLPRHSGVQLSVLTPRSTVQVIAAGYVPTLHASAQG